MFQTLGQIGNTTLHIGKGHVKIETYCPRHDVQASTIVGLGEHEAYLGGEHVQRVWPDMSEEQREIVVASRTGFWLCPKCWEEIS